MALYEFTGTTDPHTNWVTEVVLERNDQGEPSETLVLGGTAELSADRAEQLQGSLGIVLEKTTKKEQAEREDDKPATVGRAADTAGAAPVFEGKDPSKADQKQDN